MSKIVERTLDFLELFGEQKRPLSLSDISRLLKIPPSSCHDVLQALQDRGYLYELSPRGGYYPTLRIRELGRTIAENDPILLRAHIALRALRDVMSESVLLAKVNGLRATYLLALEPTHPLRFLVKVGDDVKSLHATSAGKALLGSLDRAAFEDVLKSIKLDAMTARTITTKAALRREIEAGQRSKYYLNREESIESVVTLSSSFAWTGATYLVTVAGPKSRMEARLDWAAGALVEVCRRLEMRPGSAMPVDERVRAASAT